MRMVNELNMSFCQRIVKVGYVSFVYAKLISGTQICYIDAILIRLTYKSTAIFSHNCARNFLTIEKYGFVPKCA